MCSHSVLNEITGLVVQAAKDSLGDKLDKVILYGSYARGSNDAESDIDIMVLADIPLAERNSECDKIQERLNYIDLERDIVLSLNVTDCATFYKYRSVEPFYQNIMREGLVLSAR
jgi:predicted nucleotidyltransferase